MDDELLELVRAYDEAVANDGEFATPETAAAVVEAEAAIHEWHMSRVKMGEWSQANEELKGALSRKEDDGNA